MIKAIAIDDEPPALKIIENFCSQSQSIVLEKTFTSPDGKKVTKKVELFTWEKLDYVGKVKKAFGL